MDYQNQFAGRLTKRELEVVDHVKAGRTNAEIGRVMDISFHTAKKHVENALAKTGLPNRAALAGMKEAA